MTSEIFLGVIIGVIANRTWVAARVRWRAPHSYVCPNGDIAIRGSSRRAVRAAERFHESRCKTPAVGATIHLHG